jgi:hypothetical protein
MKHYCNDSILMQEWQHKKPDSHHDIVDVMNILLLIHARTETFQKDMKKTVIKMLLHSVTENVTTPL